MYFTVVIPLFNKEKHIERAINSVLEQTYKKFEILVIDDGSTDGSFKIASIICDSRIKVIRKKNGGVSSARNMGINKSKYQYIGFLDADDAWEPTFLEEIEKMIKSFPNVGVYSTSYMIHKSINNISKSPSSEFFEANWCGVIDDYFKYSMKTPLISASSVVVPKRVFNKIGTFNENLSRGEDLYLWIKIALNYKIAYKNSVQAIYYMDAENRSSIKKGNINGSIVSIAEEELADKKMKGIGSFYYKEYMHKLIITKAKYLIYNKDYVQARKLIFKYRNTKTNKLYLIKVLFLSFMPNKVFLNISKVIYKLNLILSKIINLKSTMLGDNYEK